MAEMVYLQLAESVLAEKRKVLIRDVSKVVSDNLDLKNKIEKIELMNFSTSSKEQQVISILDIIEEIKKNCCVSRILDSLMSSYIIRHSIRRTG